MCVWCGSQDPALCTMDYDLFRCLSVCVPAAPGRLDTPFTRVRASGARNEGGLRRTRRNDPDAQLFAHPPELGERHLSGTTFCFRGGAHVYILPVGVQSPRDPIALDPAAQQQGRRPDGRFLRKPAQHGTAGVIDPVHQTTPLAALLRPYLPWEPLLSRGGKKKTRQQRYSQSKKHPDHRVFEHPQAMTLKIPSKTNK